MSDGPVGVIFDVSEETVVNGVDYTFKRFQRWNDPVVAESIDGERTAKPRDGAVIQAISEQTIDLLTMVDVPIKGTRGDTAVYGDRTLTYEPPGMLYTTPDDGDTLIGIDLEQYVMDAGDVIIDRRGWGGIFGEIEVLDSIAGDPGDYLDLEVPHQVNAKVGQVPVAQRGGTRKVQIYGATQKARSRLLQVEDAGNLAQTQPETPGTPGTTTIPIPEFDLAASVDEPLTVAVATVTNDADLIDYGVDGVEWEYAVSDSEPTDPGTPFGPLLVGFGDTDIDVPAVPSGSKVWVRARSAVAATTERSDWSAWQSITLGPDGDGTGGTLAPFTLALQIDPATGELSATANSVVAEIVKIYFLPGAAGGAAPSYADVLASASVDASGPPFTAAALATMAEGETRTVGAIGEDALGNRTVLVTASITRAVDTGAGAGTPGNFRHTFIASPPEVVRNVGADLRVPKAAIRAAVYVNTTLVGAMRAQLANHRASGAGVEVPVAYSLNGGTSWAEAGPTVSVAVTGFPKVGGFTALVAGAIGENVLITWGVKGGDGTTVVEIGNHQIEATTAVEPPDSPIPTDLPQGGPFGTIIHDLNATTQDEADGDPVPVFFDRSISGDDAAPDGSIPQGTPTFVEDAFGPGLDAVRMTGTQGVMFANPTGDSFTRYFLCQYAAAPTISGAVFFNATTGGNNAFNAAIQNDGTILAQVNDQFAFGSVDTTDDAWDGALHLHCWVFNRVTGHWWWYVDDMTDAAVQADHDCQNTFTSDAVDVWMGSRFGIASAGIDWAREVTWDAAHAETQRAAVKAAFVSAGWPI